MDLGTNIILYLSVKCIMKYLPVPKYYRRCSNMLKGVELVSSKKNNIITKLADVTHKAFQIRNDVEYENFMFTYLFTFILTYNYT